MRNLAGATSTVIPGAYSSYVLGGFVSRSVTVAAYGRTILLADTSPFVQTTSKLTASETFRGTLTYDSSYTNGTTLDPATTDAGTGGKFTITDSSNVIVVDLDGDTLWYLDKEAADQNSAGTAVITVEETI